MGSRRITSLILLTGILMGACSSQENAQDPPKSSPRGNPSESQVGKPLEYKLVSEVQLTIQGRPKKAQLSVASTHLLLDIESLPQHPLPNEIGENAWGRLDVIQTPQGEHLLVTSGDDRIVWAWVLIPNPTATIVGLETQVDYGVSVNGDMVKVSSRKYNPSGGFVVSSQLFRYNPTSGRYEVRTP